MTGNRHITVGLNTIGYPEKRNIIDPRPANVTTRQVNDPMKALDYIYFRLFKRNHRFFHNVFHDFGRKKADLYHFFNVISIGKRPWIVTYENELPRHNHQSAYLVKKLAGKPCKKIIALSHNALRVETHFLEKFPQYKNEILGKITVMHPPQQLLVSEVDPARYAGDIHFAFVGGSFFRKGGREMLHAFVRLLNDYPHAKLTVVSAFSFDHWYDTEYGEKDVAECRALMQRYPENIFYHARLPNGGVMELFSKAHVALLPSFGETFGYSVLEAQACACPVITTNAWAFPEFNSNEKGWLLDLPVTEVNGGLRGDIGTPGKKRAYAGQMEEQLYRIMGGICASPQVLQAKAAASVAGIRHNHSVEQYAANLNYIYNQALN